ncbi:MAG: phosphoribosylanthranilate isomerase [Proteobacteria bacterium]|jgi:phosphoribosylanthranilate isomerase|nr:phosphoribosylanthranilate isomerase [Pseudomonadota bacterium]MDA0996047.1 phosphoribosylanthranilate isomerase [Pseudomonadota bacterium]
MSATIKICGLRDKDAINTAINFGAKYLGFVCNYPKSPRNVSPYQLIEITNNLPDSAAYKVAVLVDPDDGLIDIIKNSIDFLQLHGSETNERILDIKRKFNLNIIKAIKIKTEEDLKQIDTYTNADDLLLDTPAMEKSELFNFNLLDNRNISSYFLAGGINIDNVVQAMQFTSKLDISSGLESEPGVKDLEKIKDFMKEVERHA